MVRPPAGHYPAGPGKIESAMKKTVLSLCLLALPSLAVAQAPPSPPPLPQWFVEIDVNKKGEVTRADFLKYRLKTFEELDANKDNKLSIDEFLKLADAPYAVDQPGGPNAEERRKLLRQAFTGLDTNGSGFVERSEAEAPLQAEFNQLDTDRDNRITEPELRLIMQRMQQRQDAERMRAEAERRKGMVTLNELIDMQMRDADKIDKNGDGRITQQEYLVMAGPADGPQSQGMLPFEIRKQLVLRKSQAIDANKDGVIDRPELTAYSVKEFFDTDTNKDRFLDPEEIKKFQEAEAERTQELVKKLVPATTAAPPARPATPAPPPAQRAPAGPPSGLPQGTR